jgi:hypothetical protein
LPDRTFSNAVSKVTRVTLPLSSHDRDDGQSLGPSPSCTADAENVRNGWNYGDSVLIYRVGGGRPGRAAGIGADAITISREALGQPAHGRRGRRTKAPAAEISAL